MDIDLHRIPIREVESVATHGAPHRSKMNQGEVDGPRPYARGVTTLWEVTLPPQFELPDGCGPRLGPPTA